MADLWTVEQAARHWGVSPSRARAIIAKAALTRVTAYDADAVRAVPRPGRGARTDLTDPNGTAMLAAEARDLAARALRDRHAPDLRHAATYPTTGGRTLRVQWHTRFEWRDPEHPNQFDADRGTIVELVELAGRVGSTDTCRPEGDAPGRYWWAHDAIAAPKPYRIAMVTDEDLAEAVRLLLTTARG
ncbi:hypothetical protein [Saccharothrix xinjiangensis]|uniref:Uncharacterized protein n=1 Tax=Saccharothrix xinjiangensis TaxID=204798 RepID=A0ABV9XW69_9PSEU